MTAGVRGSASLNLSAIPLRNNQRVHEGTSVQKALAAAFAPAGQDEQALAEALDCLRVAVTLFDADERLVYANRHYNYLLRSLPARERLTGLTYEQIIRLEIAGGEIAPTDSREPEGFIARRRAQFREGEYRPLDIHLADGRVVEIKARRTREGGWIALWSDVTQARHAQTRLEDAVSLSADAFAFFDKNDVLAMCNDRYASFYGLGRAADAIGTRFAELLARATSQRLIARIDEEHSNIKAAASGADWPDQDEWVGLREADQLHTEQGDDLSPTSGSGSVSVRLPQPGVARIRLTPDGQPSVDDEEITR